MIRKNSNDRQLRHRAQRKPDGKLSDLLPGDQFTFIYDDANGVHIVDRIGAVPPQESETTIERVPFGEPLSQRLFLSTMYYEAGSRGRARTCNPPVNSRLLYH